jgi:hypothetical protein
MPWRICSLPSARRPLLTIFRIAPANSRNTSRSRYANDDTQNGLGGVIPASHGEGHYQVMMLGTNRLCRRDPSSSSLDWSRQHFRMRDPTFALRPTTGRPQWNLVNFRA